jgi:hypothetical protein
MGSVSETVIGAPFVDPIGDLIPSYIGPRGNGLDVITSELTLQALSPSRSEQRPDRCMSSGSIAVVAGRDFR